MMRDEIAAKIREMAERLGHTPSLKEFQDETKLARRTVRKYFGNYTGALRECGLEKRHHTHWISTDRLFAEWAMVARELKKIPSIKEFEELSEFTVGPYIRRFRNWSRVPEAMADFARKNNLEEAWADVMAVIRQWREDSPAATIVKRPGQALRVVERMDRPVYGPMMTVTALVHEPTNEMGVVFLFGAVAERLGYKVTLLQTEFPDCEALLEVGPRRWQRMRIEFEYESRNFLKHGHRAEECDMIVCWLHNWPECPLDVVELREVLIGTSGHQDIGKSENLVIG